MSKRGRELIHAAAKRAKRGKSEARPPADTPTTPALSALLGYDREWVPAFKRKPKRLRTSEVAARALKKLKLTGSDLSGFDTLYPGSCIELTKPEVDEGNVEVTFLYIGDKRDDAGEYPVLTYFQPEVQMAPMGGHGSASADGRRARRLAREREYVDDSPAMPRRHSRVATPPPIRRDQAAHSDLT